MTANTDGSPTRIETPAATAAAGSPSISVVIPTQGRPVWVLDAIRSVAGQRLPDAASFEILVVENAAEAVLEPRVAALALQLGVECRHCHEARPGLHQARHRGAFEGRGEILVYIDDDVLADEGWLVALTAPFGDPQVAIVGGPVRPQWEGPRPPWIDEFPASYLSLLDCGDRRCDLRYPDGAYGCNMAVRRRVLIEVGGFNPDAMGWDRRLFWLRGDGETGLHRKVHDAGFRVVYEPRASLAHRIPASRIEPAAMRRRGLMVGLSHSFTDIRDSSGSRPQLLSRALRAAAAGARAAVLAVRRPESRVWAGSEVWRHMGYTRQHLLAFLRPSSLRYILREQYLEDPGP